jgi:hypothetical protein
LLIFYLIFIKPRKENYLVWLFLPGTLLQLPPPAAMLKPEK